MNKTSDNAIQQIISAYSSCPTLIYVHKHVYYVQYDYDNLIRNTTVLSIWSFNEFETLSGIPLAHDKWRKLAGWGLLHGYKCIFALGLARSQALPSVAENISCEVGSWLWLDNKGLYWKGLSANICKAVPASLHGIDFSRPRERWWGSQAPPSHAIWTATYSKGYT